MSGCEVIEGGGGGEGSEAPAGRRKQKKSPVWIGLIQASVASAQAGYRQMYWLKIIESWWIAKEKMKALPQI